MKTDTKSTKIMFKSSSMNNKLTYIRMYVIDFEKKKYLHKL